MVEQIITPFQIIQTLGIIFAIVGSVAGVYRQIRKEREKFALKESVKLEFRAMHNRITAVEKDVEDNHTQNTREHDNMKSDITKHFDTRFDDMKAYMAALLKTKSA